MGKQAIDIGGTYYYRGGLLQRNFQSREFNRTFETLYLVSEIRKQSFSSNASAVDDALSRLNGSGNGAVPEAPKNVEAAKGAIKIEELVKHPQKYEGKTIKVTGKCMKVNPNIMGQNWIHLQDGTANNYDLTVTTQELVQVGTVVTLEGVVTLNKDFGAGYKYNILLEGVGKTQ